MKTLAVLHVLQCNYNPLLSDVDVVYFKNPFEYLGTGNWDIQIQREESADTARERNSGFMFLHFALFIVVTSRTRRDPIRSLIKHGKTTSKIEVCGIKWLWVWRSIQCFTRTCECCFCLSTNSLQVGISLKKRIIFWLQIFLVRIGIRFELGDTCVMFHNNWIMTSEAKVYRIKELGLYYTDSDYYSNPDRYFLSYDALPASASLGRRFNTVNWFVIEEEQQALETALLTAIVLHRILILPAFACHANHSSFEQFTQLYSHPRQQCTFNTYWCVREFEKQFGEYYREHISPIWIELNWIELNWIELNWINKWLPVFILYFTHSPPIPKFLSNFAANSPIQRGFHSILHLIMLLNCAGPRNWIQSVSSFCLNAFRRIGFSIFPLFLSLWRFPNGRLLSKKEFDSPIIVN